MLEVGDPTGPSRFARYIIGIGALLVLLPIGIQLIVTRFATDVLPAHWEWQLLVAAALPSLVLPRWVAQPQHIAEILRQHGRRLSVTLLSGYSGWCIGCWTLTPLCALFLLAIGPIEPVISWTSLVTNQLNDVSAANKGWVLPLFSAFLRNAVLFCLAAGAFAIVAAVLVPPSILVSLIFGLVGIVVLGAAILGLSLIATVLVFGPQLIGVMLGLGVGVTILVVLLAAGTLLAIPLAGVGATLWLVVGVIASGRGRLHLLTFLVGAWPQSRRAGPLISSDDLVVDHPEQALGGTLHIVSAPPVRVLRDEAGRLHGGLQPAIVYADGWRIWACRGMLTPQDLEAASRMDASAILRNPDPIVQHALIDHFGLVSLIQQAEVPRAQMDDFGELYRVELAGGARRSLVKVLNATPESDGSFRDYWLEVPPDCASAREAVAWTFGQVEASYEPTVQT